MNRKEHWDQVYAGKKAIDLTWFQPEPATSLSLVHRTGLRREARVLDVGGGTSRLASFLLQAGYRKVSVLDVSGRALAIAKAQLGSEAGEVEWLEADLLGFDPPHRWELWHDRAFFHFLTAKEDRDAYCRALSRGLEPGGHVIIAAFALDGPSRCSGLDVVRYSPESLLAVIGPGYRLRGSVHEAHQTPTGKTQDFVYSWFQREGGP